MTGLIKGCVTAVLEQKHIPLRVILTTLGGLIIIYIHISKQLLLTCCQEPQGYHQPLSW